MRLQRRASKSLKGTRAQSVHYEFGIYYTYMNRYRVTMAVVNVLRIYCLSILAVRQHCAAQQHLAGGELRRADLTYVPLLRQHAMQDESFVAPDATTLIRRKSFSEGNSVPIYQSLPLMSRSRVTPAGVAKHRHGGNFYWAQPLSAAAHAESQIQPSQDIAVRARHQSLEPRPIIFEHNVLHVDQLPSLYDEYRPRRYANLVDPNATPGELNKIAVHNSTTAKAQPPPNSTPKLSTQSDNSKKKLPSKEEMRAFHDIYLRYADPHHPSFGHVESRPELFEKRFESLHAENRYKGKIVWADGTGGYGEHHWDMAHGKLR